MPRLPRASVLLALLPLAGCWGGKGDGDLVVIDDNNYSYTVAVDLESAPLLDLNDDTIDWSGLTTTMRGSAMTAADVEVVRLVYLSFTEAEMESAVATGDLTQEDVRTVWEYYPTGGDGAAAMTEFEVQGNAFDPTDEQLGFTLLAADTSWAATLWRNNTTLGAWEILSSAIVVPTAGSPNTTYAFSDTSAVLDFTVDLHSAPAVATPADVGEYTLDWSALTVDAGGHAFDPLKATVLLIAHVPDQDDVTAIEPTFLSALDGAETWTQNVYAKTDADLAESFGADGGAFPGFTEGGLWFVALLDDSGNEPAPYFLAVMDVTAGE